MAAADRALIDEYGAWTAGWRWAVSGVRGGSSTRPDIVEEMDVKVDEVDLKRGFRVAWMGGPTVHYNLSFSRLKKAPRRSASLLLRPDIVIEIERDGQPELHVFDAKLKVDGVASIDDESEEDDESDPLSFKRRHREDARIPGRAAARAFCPRPLPWRHRARLPST